MPGDSTQSGGQLHCASTDQRSSTTPRDRVSGGSPRRRTVLRTLGAGIVTTVLGATGTAAAQSDPRDDGDADAIPYLTPECRNAEDKVEVDGQTICDTDGDGLYRDWNADGDVTTGDVSEFQSQLFSDGVQSNAEAFSYAGGDTVSHGDVIVLFQAATGLGGV